VLKTVPKQAEMNCESQIISPLLTPEERSRMCVQVT